MFENKALENIGIQVIRKLEDQNIINVVNKVSNKLMTSFPDADLNYLEIYKILLDTPMYYAKIPQGLSEVNYYYKNSSIYFSEDTNLSELNEFVFHEFIHRLQERRDKKGNVTRLGVCEVNELSVKATALNEGAIQYVVSKVFNSSLNAIEIYDITIPSKTNYYPMLTNIVSQIAFLLGEDVLVNSTLKGNEDFKIEIIDNLGENEYKTIEKNLNQILQIKDQISELQKNKDSADAEKQILVNIELIKTLYFNTQNVIFKSYFDKILKRTENDIEIRMIKAKLDEYKNLVGTNSKYIDFDTYVTQFEEKAKQKAEELRNKNALMVINNNIFFRILKRIKKLFTNSQSEYYK